MVKPVAVFWFLLLVSPLAVAQIFKCVAKDGTDLYQNFPCGIDSIGSEATSPPGAKAGSAQSNPQQAKANAPLLAGAANKPPTLASEPRVGMTTVEVKAIWGEPMNLYQDELVEGRVEVWSYGPSRSVQFNLKGRVTAVER